MLSVHRFLSSLLVLALTSALALAQGPPEDKERTFVLVVGVEDYADPKITDLKYAEDDAQAVYDFFAKDPRSPTTRDRVRLLLGRQATRVEVLSAIEEHLASRAVSPRDTAILYFAGHGFSDTKGVYLATSDTKLGKLHYTAISWAELQRLWSQIGAGRRVLLADACHSGGIEGLRGPGGIGRRALAVKLNKPGFASVVIAATGANELSMEDKGSKHGVFTASLLSGLRGHADKDRDGAVSLGELTTYLTTQVPLRAREAGGKQTPTIRFNGSEPFARRLQISRGRPLEVGSEESQLARVTAERKAAERERERAELRSQLAEAKLKKLKGASTEELRRAQAEATQAKADLAKAQGAAKRVREEELKRIEAEKRAAKAEAENAELRRQLAELKGKKAEAETAAKQAADARKRAADLDRKTKVVAGVMGASPSDERALERAKSLKGFSYLDTKPFACGGKSFKIARFSHAKTGLVFHLVPGGSYQRGSERGGSNEKPVREVTIRPFLICATECTREAWARVKRLHPHGVGLTPRCPVAKIKSNEARRFASGLGLRLPTEAEWEYACRAGTTTAFYFGSEESDVWDYAHQSTRGQPTIVGQKRPNAFGLFDMLGNVLEWCEDIYAPNYTGAPTDGSATGGESGRRVVRGGLSSYGPKTFRSAWRGYGPNNPYQVGVRFAKSLE